MSRPRVVLYNPRAVFYTMPLALVALASALDRADVDVVVIDGRLERDPVATVVEAARGALCLGVSVLTGAPIRDALAVSRAVMAAAPKCTVVWGGWHPSLFPHDCLQEPAVDAVVTGQGEVAFRRVVARLVAGQAVAGRIDAGSIADLESLPRHDYGVIPVERYFVLKGRRQLDYVSSQGCRFRCAFCADPAVYGRGWSGLSPERMADELLDLATRHAVEEVAFQDETFFTHPARIARLADRLLHAGAGFTWTATLRADQACRMGEPLLAECARAGLTRVMVGVESGSQATLDRLHKDVRVEQVWTTAEMCARLDLGAIFNFIVGFPDENDTSIEATLKMAKELRARHPRFETPIFYYRPYPGNPLANRAAAEGYAFPRGLDAWADFDYVGQRGPWVSEARWRRVERFKFYNHQARQHGRWRWPLRAVSRLRCDRDWFDWPIEKTLVEWVRPPSKVS